MLNNMVGIYIHVPFCLRKCPYCAFYSVVYDWTKAGEYVAAAARNIRRYAPLMLSADTVYFGGGTPSLLSPDEVGAILDAVRQSFKLAPDAEITLEANPSSVTRQSLEGYFNCGVNRISFGVQSACDNELKMLGRLHDFGRARDAVSAAMEAGIKNISCDIMLGTPLQTMDSLLLSIDRITALQVPHISCYMLKIEEGTAYDCDKIRKLAADDDLSADMYLRLCGELRSRGYDRYEISNFAKKGFESRHNMKYWRLDEYIGIGPSAHSLFEGKRTYVPSDLNLFLQSEFQTELKEEESIDRLEEYVMLSLRTSDGISLKELKSMGADDKAVSEKARDFCRAGFLEFDGDKITLTDRGALVSNGIICELYLSAAGEG